MMSVAASRLVRFFASLILGLTPQAMNMSPLRGFATSSHEDRGDSGTRVATLRLHLLMGVVTRACVPLFRGFAASSHQDRGDSSTNVAALWLHPMRFVVTRPCVPPLRGFARPAMRMTVTRALRGYDRSPHVLGSDPRPAPKARQTYSLGREPQESGE